MGLRDDSRDYVFLSGDADPRLIENLRLTQEIADLRAKLEEAYQRIGEIVKASERAGIRWYENEDGAECAENQAETRVRRLEEALRDFVREMERDGITRMHLLTMQQPVGWICLHLMDRLALLALAPENPPSHG